MSGNTNITIPQALMGVLLTIFISVGGAYMGLRDGSIERQTKIEYLERENVDRKRENQELKFEVKELRNTQTGNYQEILKVLGEIKAELQNKQNRK
jgi:hypothetical protein